MAWADLNTIHNPATGTSPPASWGDAVRDNFQFLAGMAAAEVLTSEGTSSATYVDLATSGPAVSVTTGTKALVIYTALAGNGTSGSEAVMSHAVSGATTIAASDDFGISCVSPTGSQFFTITGIYYHSALTAGSNTFTAKYRRQTSGTATFLRRRIYVLPMP